MFLEALLTFLLLMRLRKILQTFSPYPLWERRLKWGMLASAVLFFLTNGLRIETATQWIWHLALVGILIFSFREPRFVPVRMTLYAVLPLVVISIVSNSLLVLWPAGRPTLYQYEAYVYPVAATWLIALLILSRKQLKALKEERRKRLQEEEQHRIVTARKAELEALVAERTAELQQQKEELLHALQDLKATQAQLIQREKMASLGELTAGIAHEIKNPLNFINNFSELNVELAAEIGQSINQMAIGNKEKDSLSLLLHDLVENQKKIYEHGNRADSIVKAMLQHSRKTSGQKQPVDINAFVEEYLRLSYHGIRAKDGMFNVIIETHFDPALKQVTINGEEIGRVLLNLFSNAFYAVTEKKKNKGSDYEPTVQVSTRKRGGRLEICVKDNGMGIAEKVKEKIYQPFFTTKPTGEGTGLGLSLSYDIVTKGHGGELKVETKEGQGSEFIVSIPL
ncbi:sensor histidine kinase [Flavisolibacter nicotianae]|uniref:sensor histidine kinase n=1 Tax=Flavisolibacter nicotianae TaxID=2364882 RepID=UPI000EACD37E|nr:ATP-binding protein [Flavisolibacter nicotianae]